MADPADLFREAKSQRSGSVLSLDAIQKVDEESPHQQFEWMNSYCFWTEGDGRLSAMAGRMMGDEATRTRSLSLSTKGNLHMVYFKGNLHMVYFYSPINL